MSSSSPPLAAPPLAFVSLPSGPITVAIAAWRETQNIRQRRFFSTPLQSFVDDSNESGPDDSPIESSSSIPSEYNDELSNTKTSSAPNMGASIGAQNVGEMLFNEQLLKSGRGDVRVGPMRRWKDFRGNEIVPDITVDGPN